MSEAEHYKVEATQVFETQVNPKLQFSMPESLSPQGNEERVLAGNYKSNGNSLSTWHFGFNETNDYWNYDFVFSGSLKCRFMMGDHAERDGAALTLSKSGADLKNAYIVGDYSLEGVDEEKVDEVIAQAREINIGHRLRELKNILVELKASLMMRDANAEESILKVLENVEDI